MLGKNATPAEIEALRHDLGTDLPLFYGHECITAAFPDTELNTDSEFQIPAIFASKHIRAKIFYESGKVEEISIPENVMIFRFAPTEKVRRCTFYKYQSNPFNSQLFKTFTELISFHSDYPYVTFFNFGNTLVSREPIKLVLWRGVGPSLMLMLPIFFGELVFGGIFALLAVWFRNRMPDKIILLLSISSLSISYLVVIIVLQWLLGFYWNLFPVWGFESWKNFVIPIIAGITCGVGVNIRFFRTIFSEELNREYLRTAIAKGVSNSSLYFRHLLRNAMVQIITKAGAGLPFLFTGSLLLESFFGIPGLGFAGVEALRQSDLQLLKALVMLSATLYIIINFVADTACAIADPRIK